MFVNDVDGGVEQQQTDVGRGGEYYPENRSPLRAELVVRYQRFAEFREAVLLDYGERTAFAYWGDLDDLARWCFEHSVDVLDPTTEDISRYLDRLRQAQYSPNTIARRLVAFRVFYAYLAEEGLIAVSPVADLHERRRRAPRGRAVQRRRPTRAQRARLLARAARSGPRDEALIGLLLDGVTTAQVCRARVQDIEASGPDLQASGGVLRVRNRGVPGAVALRPETTAALRRSLGGRADGPLLLDYQGRAMDRWDVRRVVRRVTEGGGQPLSGLGRKNLEQGSLDGGVS